MSRTNTPIFTVNPQTPNRQLRHRSSLEHAFNFTLTTPDPKPREIEEANFIYFTIADDCERAKIMLESRTGDNDSEVSSRNPSDDLASYDDDDDDNSYPPSGTGAVYLHRFLRALHEHSPTDAGRINLVRIILHGLFSRELTATFDRTLEAILPRARRWPFLTPDQRQHIFATLVAIAVDFLEGFFAPLTAQGQCTPSVSTRLTPSARFSASQSQGTPSRLHNLRRLCLLRDGHRCVMTGFFDKEFLTRERKARRRQPAAFGARVEAAHIIPHSLNAIAAPGAPLHEAKHFIWQIMNMFDPGVSRVLEGSAIDSPANAMLLASELHDEFGRLRCYMEELPGRPNMYAVKTVRGATALPPGFAPRPIVTLRNHELEGTEHAYLPLPRLLKIHAACCKMMQMAAAAEYVESLWDEMEELLERGTLRSDGSSDLGMVLRMKGLCDGGVFRSAEGGDGVKAC